MIRSAIVLLTLAVMAMPAIAQTPVYLDPGRTGLITVEADINACAFGAAPCEEYSKESAAATNANPVRVVIQMTTLLPVDDLQAGSFSIQTQFGPQEDSGVMLLDCPSCFEHRDGGTYSLWLVPSGDGWNDGTYFLRIGVTTGDTILPALVALEIPSFPFLSTGEPPVAVLEAVPPGRGQIGRPVLFDGSGSYDPDSPITCFRWEINSSIGSNDELVQGNTASVLFRTYDEEQQLHVSLRVSDKPEAGRLCDPDEPPVPLTMFHPGSLAIIPSYRIQCPNEPPVANAGPDVVATMSGTLVTVVLDGRNSYDLDGQIDSWRWNCGNGLMPQPLGLPGLAVCVYRAPGEYVATLTVSDNGDGTINPDTGYWNCPAQDEDSTRVTINAAGGP